MDYKINVAHENGDSLKEGREKIKEEKENKGKCSVVKSANVHNTHLRYDN